LHELIQTTAWDEIMPKSLPNLDAVAATLIGNTHNIKIEIQGHADERGDDAYNLDLSDRRVKSVRRYLIDKKVEAGRMIARGYGETLPLCRKHNEKCWSKNRRVEFVIQKRSGDIPGSLPDEDPAMGGDD
jgi:outer membrane protein OmpA-like peptidoglycan-associated protein